MTSLTTCMKKARSILNQEDEDAIYAGAQALRASGMKARAAGLGAVEQRLALVRPMLVEAEAEDARATEAQPA